MEDLFQYVKEKLYENNSLLEGLWGLSKYMDNNSLYFSAKEGIGKIENRFAACIDIETRKLKKKITESCFIKDQEINKFLSGLEKIFKEFEAQKEEECFDKIFNLYDQYQEKIKSYVPVTERVYSRNYNGNGITFYYAYGEKDEKIIVGSGRKQNHYVHFDLWLTDIKNKKWLVDMFQKRSEDIKNGSFSYIKGTQSRVSPAICFIEKHLGPVGPVALMKDYMELNKDEKIFIYCRESKQIVPIRGDAPEVDEPIIIFYDTIITGKGLHEIIDNLRNKIGTQNFGVVTLLDQREVKDASVDIRSIIENNDFSIEKLERKNIGIRSEINKDEWEKIRSVPYYAESNLKEELFENLDDVLMY